MQLIKSATRNSSLFFLTVICLFAGYGADGFFFSVSAQSITTYYVDDNVSQSGNGLSISNAFKTIQEGIDAAEPGDTVSVEPGIYRETVIIKNSGTADNIITLTSREYNQAIVRGSDPQNSGWTLVPWLDSTNNVWMKDIQHVSPYDTENGRWNMESRGEQIFLDEYPLDGQFSTGEYYPIGILLSLQNSGTSWDYLPAMSFKAEADVPSSGWTRYKMKLPAGKTPQDYFIEVSSRENQLRTVRTNENDPTSSLTYKRYIRIARMRFEHAFGTYSSAGVNVWGDNWTVDWNRFCYDGAGIGAKLKVSESTIYKNKFENNGCAGADVGSYSWVEGNWFNYNDRNGYDGWRSGGCKSCVIRDTVFYDNDFNENGGGALWLDIHSYNCTIVSNHFFRNRGNSIFVEISLDCNVIDNEIIHPMTNRTGVAAGIKLGSCSGAYVCGNTISGSDECGINLSNYERPIDAGSSYYAMPNAEKSAWLDADDIYPFKNNTVQNNTVNGAVLHIKSNGKEVCVGGWSWVHDNVIDNNSYLSDTGTVYAELFSSITKTIPQWQTATGWDLNSYYTP